MIAAMATAFPNLIDGQSVDSTDRTTDINPSNVRDIVGEFARGTPADVEQAVASARQAFTSGRGRRRRSGSTSSTAPAPRSWRARTSSGRLLSREQGKPLADGIGEAARAGDIFKFFAGEARAPPRREARLGAPGHRGRGHARAARRRRRRSRRGTFRWRFRPGRSRRRWRSATASSSSRPSSCRRRRGRSSTSFSAPGCRRACSTW